MRRGGAFKALKDIAAPAQRAILGDDGILREAEKTFNLGTSSSSLSMTGDCVIIHSGDPAARIAFGGMEGVILSWLQHKGLKNARRIRWSAG